MNCVLFASSGKCIEIDLDVSGPGVLGECVCHILGHDELDFITGTIGFGPIQFRSLRSVLRERRHVVQLN